MRAGICSSTPSSKKGTNNRRGAASALHGEGRVVSFARTDNRPRRSRVSCEAAYSASAVAPFFAEATGNTPLVLTTISSANGASSFERGTGALRALVKLFEDLGGS